MALQWLTVLVLAEVELVVLLVQGCFLDLC